MKAEGNCRFSFYQFSFALLFIFGKFNREQENVKESSTYKRNVPTVICMNQWRQFDSVYNRQCLSCDQHKSKASRANKSFMQTNFVWYYIKSACLFARTHTQKNVHIADIRTKHENNEAKKNYANDMDLLRQPFLYCREWKWCAIFRK